MVIWIFCIRNRPVIEMVDQQFRILFGTNYWKGENGLDRLSDLPSIFKGPQWCRAKAGTEGSFGKKQIINRYSAYLGIRIKF